MLSHTLTYKYIYISASLVMLKGIEIPHFKFEIFFLSLWITNKNILRKFPFIKKCRKDRKKRKTLLSFLCYKVI